MKTLDLRFNDRAENFMELYRERNKKLYDEFRQDCPCAPVGHHYNESLYDKTVPLDDIQKLMAEYAKYKEIGFWQGTSTTVFVIDNYAITIYVK